MAWTERGGPRVTAKPEQRGFGTPVIEQTLRHQLGAEFSLGWSPVGLRCAMAVRLDAGD